MIKILTFETLIPCIERLVMDNRDIPVEGKIKFLKTTKTQHGKTLQKFSLPDENETLRVISYFPDTPEDLLTNGDYIEGICNVTNKYTTLILFEKRKNKPLGTKRPAKRTGPPPSNTRGKRMIFQDDQANDCRSGGHHESPSSSRKSMDSTDLQALLDLNFSH